LSCKIVVGQEDRKVTSETMTEKTHSDCNMKQSWASNEGHTIDQYSSDQNDDSSMMQYGHTCCKLDTK